MIQEMGRACLLIFLAELGDKTQILAMAFALQFSMSQVLLGVALGAGLNHGLAVVVGAYLAHLCPLYLIRGGSALLFLGFGLWSLYGEEDHVSRGQKPKGHPIWVIALAFFLGELGDKTQLTAIALASGANFPWAVFLGTVSGMVLTSAMGIVVGRSLGERIPGYVMRLISAGVFIGFGIVYFFQAVPVEYLTARNVALFTLIVLIAIISLIVPKLRRYTSGQVPAGQLKQVAGTLKNLDEALLDLCLGSEHCRGQHCPVGYCRNLVHRKLAGRNINQNSRIEPSIRPEQVFEPAKVNHVLEVLEASKLDPALYRQLKTNLVKLANPRQ